MAGTYIPTTIALPDGAVSVRSTDTTPYYEIQQSMGSIIYGVDTIYMYSNNANQITQGLSFKKYDVNGNLSRNYDIPLISPYQYQNAVFYQPNDKKLAFDGQTRLNLKVLPSNQIDFVFYITEIPMSAYLKEPKYFDDYFFKSQYDFFKGFKDVL